MLQNFFNDYLNGREVPEKSKLEIITQQMLTCSKSTIETLEKSVKYVNDVVLVFLLLTLNIIHTFSSVSIIEFEQVNVSWEVTSIFEKKR